MRATRPAVLCCLLLAGCAGSDGREGLDGRTGPQGDTGPAGPPYFTGPGLSLALEAASLSPEGAASVTFRITDAAGTPLDAAGLLTQGAVSVRFALAELEEPTPGTAGHYRALTLEVPPGGGAARPGADSGGSLTKLGNDGRYVYAFGADVASPQAAHAHRIAAWGWRDFGGQRHLANAVLDFVPSGGPVTTRREVFTPASCGACHRHPLVHGAFRDVRLCATCHTPQAVDADTGRSLELGVLLHKVHAGKALPSVVVGGTYSTVDDAAVVHDFSEVSFPQDLRRCTSCHAGAQADLWKTRPTRTACGSCHDTTSFVDPLSATSHVGGVMANDSTCGTCHGDAGSSPIAQRHPGALVGKQLGLEIISVTDTAPGQQPVVTFRVTVDGAARNVLATPVSRIGALVAGPTKDYASSWSVTIQGTSASGTLTAVDATDGVFAYTLPVAAAIPANATGSYAIALEGYAELVTPRLPALSRAFFFAVTDVSAVPRRAVVDDAACDACHAELLGHSSRRGVAGCLMCHNPNNPGDERAPHLESATVEVPSVDFRVLIHKIHRGTALSVQPYLVGGSPAPLTANPMGTQIDFGRVRFPGDLRDCRTCHLPGTFDLPLAAGLLPTRTETRTCNEDPAADTNSYCQPANFVVTGVRLVPPEAAACTSCHDAPYVAAHAETQTTAAGVEGCATCHASGAAYGMDVVHPVAP